MRERIEAARRRAGTAAGSVRLIAVTKTLSAEVVAAARAAGVTEFGENYVAELEAKRPAARDATWHFVGRVQTNKAQRVIASSEVVHTLEPGRAAERLARLGRERGRPVTALVEVDFAGGRVGVAPTEAERFVTQMHEAGGIEIRGLMTVAPRGEDPRRAFAALRALRDRLDLPGVTELSMGMSGDLDEAVEEGATMVRVGSAIFGPRS